VQDLIAGHGLKNSGVSKGHNNILQHICVLHTDIWAIGQTVFLSDIPQRKVKNNKKCISSPSKLYKSGDGRAVLIPEVTCNGARLRHREMQAQNCPCIKSYFDCCCVTPDVWQIYCPINWGQSTDSFSVL